METCPDVKVQKRAVKCYPQIQKKNVSQVFPVANMACICLEGLLLLTDFWSVLLSCSSILALYVSSARLNVLPVYGMCSQTRMLGTVFPEHWAPLGGVLVLVLYCSSSRETWRLDTHCGVDCQG